MRTKHNRTPASPLQRSPYPKQYGNPRKPMDHIKHIFDGVSYGVAVATLAGWLPHIASLISICWIAFQFYHSVPMKEWRAERAARKALK